MPLYVIDTLVQFRHKYVIEADELDHAYDEIVMRDSGNPDDEFEEISQRFLGETIIDGRQVSYEEYENMMKTLQNDKSEMCSYWMGDKLIRKINYDRD